MSWRAKATRRPVPPAAAPFVAGLSLFGRYGPRMATRQAVRQNEGGGDEHRAEKRVVDSRTTLIWRSSCA